MPALLDEILSDENMKLAQKHVYANKGAGGVDGVTVQELTSYMEENWQSIKEQIQKRTYKPQPVLRVEIPKPNGGVRKLGIPTVIDRTIEQAITQLSVNLRYRFLHVTKRKVVYPTSCYLIGFLDSVCEVYAPATFAQLFEPALKLCH